MFKRIDEKTIRDLCERSRLGDQVATDIIAHAANGAKRGDKQAKRVRDAVLKWCKAHPVKLTQSPSMFGIESPPKEAVVPLARRMRQNIGRAKYSPKGLAVMILSLGEYATGILFHGPELFADERGPNPIVESVRSAVVGETCLAAFDFGNQQTNQPELVSAMLEKMTPPEQKACHLGILVGRARRLQAVALPNTPIAILSVDTAWELGE